MTRTARVERATKETTVTVELELDGSGKAQADTGIPFLDHMLEQLGKHGRFDLSVAAKGDLEIDAHHTVEDIGIATGQALAEALGDKAGIRRFGHSTVPLDEARVAVALDLSGRPHVEFDVPVAAEVIGTYDPGLTEDFIRAFATTAQMTLHAKAEAGRAPHHIVEALFKALAVALRDAVTVIGGDTPSTKGVL
jgi:imidazoleglycerol-phosphate dehydratase